MSQFIDILTSYGDHFKNSVTVVDVSKDDQPLIYVNKKFCEISGYKSEEVIGQNCRFLQGPDSDKESVKKIRELIRDRKVGCEDILNYKKDGTIFYNRLVLFPHEQFFFGLQNEIPESKFQKFNNPDPDKIRHEGLNPLTIIYLSLLNSPDSETETVKKLDSCFERIHQLIINM